MLYFSEWRAKFRERQVQNQMAKAKHDESWQTKDIVPNAQSNVMPPPLLEASEGHDYPAVRAVGVDETPRTGR